MANSEKTIGTSPIRHQQKISFSKPIMEVVNGKIL